MWNYLDRGVSPHGNSCHMKGIPAQTPPRFVWPTKPVFVQEGTARARRRQGWRRPQGPVPLWSLALSPPTGPLNRWPPSRVPASLRGLCWLFFSPCGSLSAFPCPRLSASVSLCAPSPFLSFVPGGGSVCPSPTSILPTPLPLLSLGVPTRHPMLRGLRSTIEYQKSHLQDAPPQGSDKCDKWDQRPWE